VASAEHTFA